MSCMLQSRERRICSASDSSEQHSRLGVLSIDRQDDVSLLQGLVLYRRNAISAQHLTSKETFVLILSVLKLLEL